MRLARPKKVELLAAVPLFSRCSKRELATVAKLAHDVELPAGHTLIREDARVAYSFFVLVEGERRYAATTVSSRRLVPETSSASWR